MVSKKNFKIVIVDNDEDELLFMKKGFTTSGSFEVAAQV